MSETTQDERRPSNLRRGILVLLPLIVFLALAALFYVGLHSGDPSLLPSALIGKHMPKTDLPPVAGLKRDGKPVAGLSDATFKGKVTLVNVWASWCVPCHDEVPFLEQLSHDKRFQLVGINYKDAPDDARRFLGRYGNPYAAVGADRSGREFDQLGRLRRAGDLRDRPFGHHPLQAGGADHAAEPARRADAGNREGAEEVAGSVSRRSGNRFAVRKRDKEELRRVARANATRNQFLDLPLLQHAEPREKAAAFALDRRHLFLPARPRAGPRRLSGLRLAFPAHDRRRRIVPGAVRQPSAVSVRAARRRPHRRRAVHDAVGLPVRQARRRPPHRLRQLPLEPRHAARARCWSWCCSPGPWSAGAAARRCRSPT